MTNWKQIRITRDAWAAAKKEIAGEDVDLDDFLSFIIEGTDLSRALTDYLEVLEKEGEAEEEGEEASKEEPEDIAYDPKLGEKTRRIKGGWY